MLKVMSVLGTRPEGVKMAPVIKELTRRAGDLHAVVCVTGQHREMLNQVLKLFDIHPDIDLNLMQPGQRLSDLTARILTAMDDVIQREKPDWILVQGDTTTVMAASLAAFYHRVKVGHVEAGLRSGDKYRPFPEEINRRIADVLSDLYFAPTETSRDNLLRENVPAEKIVVTGNTVIDALLDVAGRVDEAPVRALVPHLGNKRLILVTSHRRENFGEPFRDICRALRDVAVKYDDAHIVYPVHYNPNVKDPAREMLGDVPNITLTEPVDYLTIVALMKRAHFIMTDSGGIQEEAPSLGKPVLVLREVTERQEVVAAGAAKLVGSDYRLIMAEASRLMDDSMEYARMASIFNPYGDGQASRRIVDAIVAARA
jgi:UDP-N-acetylglucosamine 2-epimerase (non-hydrolysing)